MRLIHPTILLLLVTLLALPRAGAADNGQTGLTPHGRETPVAGERVSFQAILVIASDQGTTDANLAAHEPALKRVLRFKSFRRVGAGSSQPLGAKDETTIALTGGYNLDVWINWMTDREVDFGVRWFKGSRTLVNTTMTRPRRATAILGGPAVEDGPGTYAVIVTTH